jgi:TRAP-type C4-dicarboxylate transport system permease small subunit
LFTAFERRSRVHHHNRYRAFIAMALLCLALLALLTVAQITHVHPVNTETDNCPLCIVMHTASPVAAAAVAIILVQVARASAASDVRPISRHWHAQLLTRPPPPGC